MMGLPMSGLRKHRPAALLAAAAAVLAVAACGGGSGSSSGGSAIKQGGVFRMGTSSTIDSLNPFIAIQSDAYTTFEYIYPTLVQYTPSLKIVENFARSWKTSPDGRTWTFTTQPNAKWSDGKPLTAADAAWTFSTILKFANGATANSAGYVAHMKSATAPNATTLVLTYSQPVANVLSQVQQVPIMPEHIWAQYATGNGKALKTFQNNAPIVSGGPFILTKYTPKQVALFKKNPAFYGPKPHIDGFGLQFFQTTDAEVTALKSGQLDGVEVPVPPTSVATLKAAHFLVRSSPGDSFDDFIINSNPQQQASHKELLNPLLRQAFDHAIDRQAVVATSLLGHGQPGSTIIPPATGQWSDPSIKPVSFSLATADQLLDQAGYKMGPNGLRIANGHPMSYTVIMPSDLAGQYLTRIVPDHPAGLQEDRRAAEPEGPRPLGRLRRDLGQQLPQLRDLHVGLVPADRPRLHALGADLQLLRRVERHRILQQGLRQPVLPAERGDEPGAAAAGGLPDAADDRLRPAVPGDRLPGLDRGAEQPLEPPA